MHRVPRGDGAPGAPGAGTIQAKGKSDMTRNLKVLGLAFIVTLALSAVVASAASAASALFTAEGVPSDQLSEIHGEQATGTTDTFTIEGLPALTCTTVKETGFPEESEVHKKGGSAPSATFTPEYATCHVVLLGITKWATVTMNGCTYTFTATKNTANTPFSADLTINCSTSPPEKQIEIHVYNNAAHTELLCTYDVRHQVANNQIQLTNEASDILAHINATVLVHNTKPGGVCGSKETPNAVYKGTHTLRATNGGIFTKTSVS